MKSETRWIDRLKKLLLQTKMKILRQTNTGKRDYGVKDDLTIRSSGNAHVYNGSIVENVSTIRSQELMGLFSSTCTSLSTLIPYSSSRYPTLMDSDSGYCDVFRGNPFEGTKCGICIQNHFGSVNKTNVDPFFFTIQFGVDQKVPKAQLIMTRYSNDLQGIKSNLPYTLLHGHNEYEISDVELKVGDVEGVRLKAVVDVSYEIDGESATGRAFVSFDLIACLPKSEVCYDALPMAQFVHPLEMSETRIRALQSLGEQKGERGSTENFQQPNSEVESDASIQQKEL